MRVYGRESGRERMRIREKRNKEIIDNKRQIIIELTGLRELLIFLLTESKKEDI